MGPCAYLRQLLRLPLSCPGGYFPDILWSSFPCFLCFLSILADGKFNPNKTHYSLHIAIYNTVVLFTISYFYTIHSMVHIIRVHRVREAGYNYTCEMDLRSQVGVCPSRVSQLLDFWLFFHVYQSHIFQAVVISCVSYVYSTYVYQFMSLSLRQLLWVPLPP